MGPWYATREAVKTALDVKFTARSDAQVDRVIEDSSRDIDSRLNRVFYPTLGTRYKDFPTRQRSRPWRIWLDDDELISLTGVTCAGRVLDVTHVFPEPINSGPPYDRIEVDVSSSISFSAGSTWQRAVAITGLWGYNNVNAVAGATAEVLDATETGVDVTDSFSIGVGDLITVDSERMLVTGKQSLTTGQTGTLTSDKAATTLAVADGTQFVIGEVLTLDAERVRVIDVTGNNLTVIRAWDGTVLAAHTGATIYAPRTLVVTRGVLGTTATTHLQGATVYRQVYPGPVVELCVAQSVDTLQQELSGYSRAVGSGDNSRPATGSALAVKQSAVYRSHGRKVRHRAVI